jgi:hypothetical protein
MSLKQEKIIDKIEITESGAIQVREATVISDTGKEISRSFHRYVIQPGDDYSGEADNVKAICKVVHTEEAISAHKDKYS